MSTKGAALRLMLRRATVMVCVVLVSPAIAVARVASAIGADSVFISFGCLFGLWPGRIGSCLRVAYYLGTLEHVSTDVLIGFGSFFSKRSAALGRFVNIGAYCVIGSVRIGDQVWLASRVSVTSGRHQHGDASRGVELGDLTFRQISIGSRTWIGEGAIVMADVGTDCIVGAGSVVVKPIPDGSVVAGNPAKVIRTQTHVPEESPADACSARLSSAGSNET